MDAMTATQQLEKPSGIYFGLPEKEYHADRALGSSGMRKLALNPSSYWFESWMNPKRPPERSASHLDRGRAVHALVLYGEATFDQLYMRGAEHDETMSQGEKAALTKAANKKAAERGMIALNARDYDNIAIAGAMLAKNPELATALVGGINEVSVFWAAGGIRRKARIDCLKPRGLGDLKSIANRYDKPFQTACIHSISTYRYDVQAAHYMEARAQIPQLVADGCVYGIRKDEERDQLDAVVKSKTWAWQWVWWQSEGAPITYSKVLSPKNPLLSEIAQATIEKAENNYRAYMDRFGPNEMWLLVEKPSELFLEELPPWHARD